jgi:hypothetical protein
MVPGKSNGDQRLHTRVTTFGGLPKTAGGEVRQAQGRQGQNTGTQPVHVVVVEAAVRRQAAEERRRAAQRGGKRK